MGLPPALAARLAKRGIKVENRKKEDEEVFAEDKITAILDEFGKKLPKSWDKVGVCVSLNREEPFNFQAWDSQYETWYYWNNLTMKVSWLNPDDPESEITDPADKDYGDFAQPTQPSR